MSVNRCLRVLLCARLPPNDAIVSLDKSGLPADLEKWPSFHNGVAAGLRLPPGQAHATRTWIVYNKPESLTDGHAGVLMVRQHRSQSERLSNSVWKAVSISMPLAHRLSDSLDSYHRLPART